MFRRSIHWILSKCHEGCVCIMQSIIIIRDLFGPERESFNGFIFTLLFLSLPLSVFFWKKKQKEAQNDTNEKWKDNYTQLHTNHWLSPLPKQWEGSVIGRKWDFNSTKGGQNNDSDIFAFLVCFNFWFASRDCTSWFLHYGDNSVQLKSSKAPELKRMNSKGNEINIFA